MTDPTAKVKRPALVSTAASALVLALVAGACVVLSGCHAPSRTSVREPAQAAKSTTSPTILDVRTPGEFNSGHLQGAVNLPVDQVGERIARVVPDKSTPLLVHCQGGRRSAAATKQLEALGYTNVTDLGSIQHAREVTGK